MATMVSGGLTTTYGYDAAANLTTTTLPAANGYIEVRTYDRSGRLTEVKNQKGAAIFSRSTYTLDPVGNRLSIQTTSGTETYAYDVLDRLTQACFVNSRSSVQIRVSAPQITNRSRPRGRLLRCPGESDDLRVYLLTAERKLSILDR